jgi:hypothetical protein
VKMMQWWGDYLDALKSAPVKLRAHFASR